MLVEKPIDEIISEFKNLDLSKQPVNEIQKLMTQVGRVSYMRIVIHKGATFMRARPNKEDERFRNKSDLSFKPQIFNKTYQRASTPNQTMFYASFLPVIPSPLEFNTRIIGALESLPWLRDKTTSGYKRITFSKWLAEEDLNLFAIIAKDEFYTENDYTKEIVDAYNNFIKQEDVLFVERSLKYHKFIADEFAKEVDDDTDYMISALFTETVTQNPNIDGILYPSMRVNGKGFNVAIKPESCKKIALYAAGECSIYKRKGQTVIGNDSIVELDGKTDNFEFAEIPNYRKECLEQLGVKTIDELI
ncbi:hypothetical protein [uncultured Acetobacteroides sp.]|uniref:hypothetical protein n=1 Tax=uncultured Acetobacteroides sp. TaxID=1760811 RepID=UPI0029F59BA9|nr:hypothetical protein [uncultured Acetobacteroides sp.]